MDICGEGVEDLVRGFVPGVGAGVIVPGVDPVLDRVFEFGDGSVGTASDPFGGEFGEPGSTRFIQEL